jgi:hypothetical protein
MRGGEHPTARDPDPSNSIDYPFLLLPLFGHGHGNGHGASSGLTFCFPLVQKLRSVAPLRVVIVTRSCVARPSGDVGAGRRARWRGLAITCGDHAELARDERITEVRQTGAALRGMGTRKGAELRTA